MVCGECKAISPGAQTKPGQCLAGPMRADGRTVTGLDPEPRRATEFRQRRRSRNDPASQHGVSGRTGPPCDNRGERDLQSLAILVINKSSVQPSSVLEKLCLT
jgi:hypothetical protein